MDRLVGIDENQCPMWNLKGIDKKDKLLPTIVYVDGTDIPSIAFGPFPKQALRNGRTPFSLFGSIHHWLFFDM